MGNICLSKSDNPIEYKTNLKQLSSTITDHPEDADPQVLQLVTLTSQNTESSFNIEGIENVQSKNVAKHKTISDFQIVRPLGKGAFGQVMLVKDKSSQKYYALKIIYKDTIKNHEQKVNALSQRYLLEALDFPFIVKLHYAFQSKTKLYLLVDFMSGGQLFYLLRSQKVFEEEVAKFYAAEILLALEYLHNRNIIFRDLKPENVLLTKEGHVKLADFGLSKICFSRNQLAYSICGTPQYIAPEIILGKGYDQSADWFSFGSLIYDMLTGKPPFYSKNKHQILSNISSKQVPIPSNLSQEAQSLLRGLFKIKPKNRLGYKGAEEVKQHQFFKNVDFDKLKALQIKPPISFINCDLNNQGFDQLNISVTQLNLEQTNSQGKLPQDAFFKNFTYFKQQTYSFQNRQSENEQVVMPLNQRFNLNPLILSQIIQQVKVKRL